MGQESLKFNIELTEFTCGNCSGVYALTQKYVDWKYEASGYWNCPYCQTPWGYGESELDRVKDELRKEKARKERALSRANEEQQRADKEAARAEAEQMAKQRLKKRIANGVCPCCNRTFSNLYRHMQTKHPEYISNSASLKAIRKEMEFSQNKLGKALGVQAGYISNYENGKYVPDWAREIIEEWINESR